MEKSPEHCTSTQTSDYPAIDNIVILQSHLFQKMMELTVVQTTVSNVTVEITASRNLLKLQ